MESSKPDQQEAARIQEGFWLNVAEAVGPVSGRKPALRKLRACIRAPPISSYDFLFVDHFVHVRQVHESYDAMGSMGSFEASCRRRESEQALPRFKG